MASFKDHHKWRQGNHPGAERHQSSHPHNRGLLSAVIARFSIYQGDISGKVNITSISRLMQSRKAHGAGFGFSISFGSGFISVSSHMSETNICDNFGIFPWRYTDWLAIVTDPWLDGGEQTRQLTVVSPHGVSLEVQPRQLQIFTTCIVYNCIVNYCLLL